MSLSNHDLELLQDALLEIHETRDLDGLRAAAPRIFAKVVPAEFFLWLEGGQARIASLDGDVHVWQAPVRMTRSIFESIVALADQHPFARHVMRTGDPGPMRLSDFWTRAQQLASQHHREIYRHMDVGRLLSMVTVRASRGGVLNLTRSFRRPDFSERDRHLMRLLAPHFLQAVGAAEEATARRDAESQSLRRLGLTPRERDVASWLARGRTNPEIAAILAAKPRTVEKHVEKILLKLGVENRTAAARVILGTWAVRGGPEPADPERTRSVLRHVILAGRKRRRL